MLIVDLKYLLYMKVIGRGIMRKIKFRVWTYEDKEIIPWEDVKKIPLYNIIEDVNESYQLLQYTGVEDKNRKEIYEGDIVKYKGGSHIVSFHRGAWILKKVGKLSFHFLLELFGLERKDNMYFNDLVEVIGNLYDNPELLED
jgi:uncharacterized phage protein (TIGR01671 family)